MSSTLADIEARLSEAEDLEPHDDRADDILRGVVADARTLLAALREARAEIEKLYAPVQEIVDSGDQLLAQNLALQAALTEAWAELAAMVPDLPPALLHVCRGNVGRISWEIEQDADALRAQWVREGRLLEPVRRFYLDGDVILVGAGGPP